jgi:hypothetical protein
MAPDPPTESTMAFCPGSSLLRSICLDPFQLAYRTVLDIQNDNPHNKSASDGSREEDDITRIAKASPVSLIPNANKKAGQKKSFL